MSKEVRWSDKKRPFLGLPLSFTKYSLTDEKLYISMGALNKKEDEVRLYRIQDVTLIRSFGQRLVGVGTIRCNSSDKSMPLFDIKNIRNATKVRDMLSDLVEEQRNLKRVTAREITMSDYSDMSESEDQFEKGEV